MTEQACATCGATYDAEEFDDCPDCASAENDSLTDLDRAQDPSTDSDLLGRLAFSSDPDVAAAVLANPSTPDWAVRRFGGSPTGAGSSDGPSGPSRVGPWLGTSTMESWPGYEVAEIVGMVVGTASTNWKQGNRGGMFNKQEGRVDWAVGEAINRMTQQARTMRANAVLSVHTAINESEGTGMAFKSSGAAAVGTAVRLVRSQDGSKAGEGMKVCGVCREVVRDEARKCRFCLEWFDPLAEGSSPPRRN